MNWRKPANSFWQFPDWHGFVMSSQVIVVVKRPSTHDVLLTVCKKDTHMIVRQLRLEKGWSQEDLAQLSGLSVRTIQRIEKGRRVGPESLKCLAAVFETNFGALMKENKMSEQTRVDPTGQRREEGEAIEFVENLKAFHMNWITYVIIIPCLCAINMYLSPDVLWVVYPAVIWLGAIALHGLVMYGLFGKFNTKWEQTQIEKYLHKD